MEWFCRPKGDLITKRACTHLRVVAHRRRGCLARIACLLWLFRLFFITIRCRTRAYPSGLLTGSLLLSIKRLKQESLALECQNLVPFFAAQGHSKLLSGTQVTLALLIQSKSIILLLNLFYLHSLNLISRLLRLASRFCFIVKRCGERVRGRHFSRNINCK